MAFLEAGISSSSRQEMPFNSLAITFPDHAQLVPSGSKVGGTRVSKAFSNFMNPRYSMLGMAANSVLEPTIHRRRVVEPWKEIRRL